MSRRRFLPAFLAVTFAAAAATAVGAFARASPPRFTGPALVIAALVVATEFRPVKILHRSQSIEVAASTAFSLALLLLGGLAAALAAQLGGSLLGDLSRRKSPVKVCFNLAQYTLALGTAHAVLVAFGDIRPFRDAMLSAQEVPGVVGAALAFYLVNNLLVWMVVSLATDTSLLRRIGDEWLFQTSTSLLLLGLSPVIDLVARISLPMLPFLLLPVGAVYVTARSWTRQAYQALHDGLTGLANRTLFHRDVAGALDRMTVGKCVAVLLFDLDRFKEINDTLGHHTGDVLLQQVGPRAGGVDERVASVARFGGDEFAMLLTDISGPEDALDVARRVSRAFTEPFTVDEDTALEVEASIGVAVAPEHGTGVELLLQHADVAMYLAKESRTGAELYSPERDQNSRRRLTLISQLRVAIDRGELTLYYQPKMHLATGRYSGVEALARWHHPTLGLVPPNDFIPLAERTGLINPMTRHFLAQAIDETRTWHQLGLPLRVAVNVSARNLHDPDLPAVVQRLLAESDLAADSLELEITETELMMDPERAARVLARLHDMGTRLTIDDFGTGYSSLSYIRSLPVDEIKIDRSFIAAMDGRGGSVDDIIVRSTIDLARNLGLAVTAEGVETEDQLRRLAELGCDYAQGFLLRRPAPFHELTGFLAQRHGALAAAGI